MQKKNKLKYLDEQLERRVHLKELLRDPLLVADN